MGRSRKLVRQLLPSYLLIAILSIVAVEGYALIAMSHFNQDSAAQRLEGIAKLVRRLAAGPLAAGNTEGLAELMSAVAEDAGVRVTVIAADGQVLVDSDRDPAAMDNHQSRAEVMGALDSGFGRGPRYSATTGEETMYIALAVSHEGETTAVVRTAKSQGEISGEVRGLQVALSLAGALVALGVVLVSLIMARRIGRPIRKVTEAAEQFALGDFEHRLEVSEYQEMQSLGDALHRLAALAEENIRTADRMRHLEAVRSDFVSNVSHELKTPITSIKGFVETLQGGALEDPETARRFLEIIARQTDRLNAIIEDLLSLSRLEEETATQRVVLRMEPMEEVLRAAVLHCQPLIRERGGVIELSCTPDVRAAVNGPLLELAVANLIDNALKYSAGEPLVWVSGVRDGDEVLIKVADKGQGIPLEHQDRVFERFYRVDKARSRSHGGTGLGLALVKHIVLAHHGRISLDSVPGEGSTFSIFLPIQGTGEDQ